MSHGVYISEIISLIGREKAFYLLGQLKGTERRPWRLNLYVPKKVKENHFLVRTIGLPDALKMSEEFGGMNLQLSNGRYLVRRFRNKMIRHFVRRGSSVKDIADIMRVSKRTVSNIISS